MVDHPHFTTERRGASPDEMSWGTELGRAWDDAIAESDRVAVSETAGVTPTAEVPDSEANQKLAHRWILNGVNETVEDTAGNSDGENNGVTYIDGDWAGGAAANGGNGDYINIGTLGSYGSSLDDDYAVAFSFQSDSDGAFWGTYEGTGEVLWGVELLSDGSIRFDQREGPGSYANLVAVETDSALNDNNPHRVVWNKTSQDPNDWEIYADGASVSFTVTDNQGPPNDMNDFTQDIPLFASQGERSVSNHYDDTLNDVCFFNDSLTGTEATSYEVPWA